MHKFHLFFLLGNPFLKEFSIHLLKTSWKILPWKKCIMLLSNIILLVSQIAFCVRCMFMIHKNFKKNQLNKCNGILILSHNALSIKFKVSLMLSLWPPDKPKVKQLQTLHIRSYPSCVPLISTPPHFPSTNIFKSLALDQI